MTVVAIISQKGGAGKTTLAVHLATAAHLDGHVTLVIDIDPQATASEWGSWRKDQPPEVIDSAPPRLAAKIEKAREQGAEFVVIDSPPHANTTAAGMAAAAADLILIPCRPSGFDLAAIEATAGLVRGLGKPAFVVFMAGPPKAPKLYADAAAVVEGWGLGVCPYHVADRAAFRHATADGKTVMEIDPYSRASEEIRALYVWACETVNYPTSSTGEKTV